MKKIIILIALILFFVSQAISQEIDIGDGEVWKKETAPAALDSLPYSDNAWHYYQGGQATYEWILVAESPDTNFVDVVLRNGVHRQDWDSHQSLIAFLIRGL
jgi:hypothetical protein